MLLYSHFAENQHLLPANFARFCGMIGKAGGSANRMLLSGVVTKFILSDTPCQNGQGLNRGGYMELTAGRLRSCTVCPHVYLSTT